jgi:hypothetical protein
MPAPTPELKKSEIDRLTPIAVAIAKEIKKYEPLVDTAASCRRSAPLNASEDPRR